MILTYADEITPYPTGNDIEELIGKLQNASKTLFKWFADSQMKANPAKCHFICSTSEKLSLIVENQQKRTVHEKSF